MALPNAKEPRRFYRAAEHRFEEAQFLFEQGGYTTAAVYLAGYAVECMLKALILTRDPKTQHRATLATFRGQAAHDFEWLRAQLAQRSVHLAKPVSRALIEVTGWTTSLRYDPSTMRRRDAEAFLKAADAVVLWVKGRI
jgi:HEPN domain-containing protein